MATAAQVAPQGLHAQPSSRPHPQPQPQTALAGGSSSDTAMGASDSAQGSGTSPGRPPSRGSSSSASSRSASVSASGSGSARGRKAQRESSPPGLTNSTPSPESSSSMDDPASIQQHQSDPAQAFQPYAAFGAGAPGSGPHPQRPFSQQHVEALLAHLASVGSLPPGVNANSSDAAKLLAVQAAATGSQYRDALANAQAWHQMDFQQQQQQQSVKQEGATGSSSSAGEGDDEGSDQMFEEMIASDSFEHPNSAAGTSAAGTSAASAPIPMQPSQQAGFFAQAPPAQMHVMSPWHASPHSGSATPMSMLAVATPGLSAAGVQHGSGSHYSHTCDADVGYTAHTIVRPERSELAGLQVHVHGVALSGAKSRVETQIRMRLELVRPVPDTPDARVGEQPVPPEGIVTSQAAAATAAARFGPPSRWQRIGTFTHIKLPPMTGTRRKAKKIVKSPPQVDPERTLFVDATVVNATPPHARVYVCDGCRARERKRVLRTKMSKKAAAEAVKKAAAEGKSVALDDAAQSLLSPDGEPMPEPDELREMGIDPDAPDAKERAFALLEERAKKRVVLFNTGDYVEFHNGEAILPTRITCYCRHHKEKVGFCIIFTMRDWTGELLATGTTPPIMITDDHKTFTAGGLPLAPASSSSAAAAAAAASAATAPAASLAVSPGGITPTAAAATAPPAAAPTKGSRSRSHTVDADNAKPAKSGAARAKPYARKSLASALAAAPSNAPASQPLSASPSQQGGASGARSPSSSAAPSTSAAGSALSPASAAPAGESPGSAALFEHANATAETLGRLVDAMRKNASIESAAQSRAQSTAASPTASSAAPAPAAPAQAQAQAQIMPHAALLGSLSPDTLQTAPQSQPMFDFDEFITDEMPMAMLSQRYQQYQQQQAQQQAQQAPQSAPHIFIPQHPPALPSAATASTPASLPASTPAAASSTYDSIYDAIMRDGSAQDGSNGARSAAPPKITRLIPGEGPTSGGIEVTVLGENFVEGITVLFGDNPAISTKVWAANTLVCVLPPSPSPGPVIVSFKLPTYGLNGSDNGHGPSAATSPAAGPGHSHTHSQMAFFNYIEMTDRSLMELALQVVGLQMTGRMQSARDVAMRVVGSGHGTQGGQVATGGSGSGFGGAQQHGASSMDMHAVLAAALTARRADGTALSFQDSLINFLTVLDTDAEPVRADAIRLANRQGHTLLHLAVILGLQRLVDDLLRRGAPVNARDGGGFTALHFACVHGRISIARRLLEHHASADVLTSSGRTPLDLAREHDQDDIVDLLEAQDSLVSTRSISEITDSALALDADLEDDSESAGSMDDGDASDEASGTDAESDAGSDDASEDVHHQTDVKTEKQAEVAREKESKLLAPHWNNRFFVKNDSFDWAHTLSSMQAIMPSMHMPAIPVFHVAVPWPTPSPRRERKTVSEPSTSDSEDSHGKMYSLWRSLLAPVNQSTPPPAYETAVQEAPAPADKGEGSSTGPGTLASSSAVEATGTGTSAESLTARRRPSKPSTVAAVTKKKDVRKLREDRMLVWFWIPVLLFFSIILIFSSSNSVLSMADLVSYIPFASQYTRHL